METKQPEGLVPVDNVPVIGAKRPLEERIARFNEGMRVLSVENGLTIGAQPYMDGDAIRLRLVCVEIEDKGEQAPEDVVVNGSV